MRPLSPAEEFARAFRVCLEIASNFRRQIVNYAIGDAYANAFAPAGSGEAVSKVRELWDSGDRKAAVEAVPSEMCLDLVPLSGWCRIA